MVVSFILITVGDPVRAETVDVKYRGPVDLAKFECTGELDSSVVKRVCYNAKHSYMLIRLKQTWYHYREIDQGTVSALLAACAGVVVPSAHQVAIWDRLGRRFRQRRYRIPGQRGLAQSRRETLRW
ncbi:hypothetical protein A9174_03750 [Mesorhizobium loti NZP2037]|nr:hypothetical protein A9174_03750 [Mesorhizobium loti NZP2037]